MKTTVKKLSDSRVEITVTLDAKDLKPAKEKALEKLAKEVHVEGFRKGKVPVDVAKKFIPENDLNAETVDAAVRITVIEAFSKNEKSPLVLPSVNVTKYVPDEVVEYTATADIIPEIKLGDFKKLGVKKEEVKVSEKEIKEILDNIATSFAEKKTVKRAAKEGDDSVVSLFCRLFPCRRCDGDFRAVPLNSPDILFKLSPGPFHTAAAAQAAQAEIRPAPQHLPAQSAAGVRLFHGEHIVFPDIHDYFPLMLSQYFFAACSVLLSPYS